MEKEIKEGLNPDKDYIMSGRGEVRGEYKPKKKKYKTTGKRVKYMLTIFYEPNSIFNFLYTKMTGKNRIFLTMSFMKKVAKELEISTKSIYRFIDKEIKADVMIKVRQGEYFVNPTKHIKCSTSKIPEMALEYYTLKSNLKPKPRIKKPRLLKLEKAQ